MTVDRITRRVVKGSISSEEVTVVSGIEARGSVYLDVADGPLAVLDVDAARELAEYLLAAATEEAEAERRRGLSVVKDAS
jgi:hypothetical protein